MEFGWTLLLLIGGAVGVVYNIAHDVAIELRVVRFSRVLDELKTRYEAIEATSGSLASDDDESNESGWTE